MTGGLQPTQSQPSANAYLGLDDAFNDRTHLLAQIATQHSAVGGSQRSMRQGLLHRHVQVVVRSLDGEILQNRFAVSFERRATTARFFYAPTLDDSLQCDVTVARFPLLAACGIRNASPAQLPPNQLRPTVVTWQPAATRSITALTTLMQTLFSSKVMKIFWFCSIFTVVCGYSRAASVLHYHQLKSQNVIYGNKYPIDNNVKRTSSQERIN